MDVNINWESKYPFGRIPPRLDDCGCILPVIAKYAVYAEASAQNKVSDRIIDDLYDSVKELALKIHPQIFINLDKPELVQQIINAKTRLDKVIAIESVISLQHESGSVLQFACDYDGIRRGQRLPDNILYQQTISDVVLHLLSGNMQNQPETKKLKKLSEKEYIREMKLLREKYPYPEYSAGDIHRMMREKGFAEPEDNEEEDEEEEFDTETLNTETLNKVLIRVKGLNIQQLHKPPCDNGFFFALEDANDLPLYHVEDWQIIKIPVTDAIKIGRLYMQNAENANGWVLIKNVADMPDFTNEIDEDYDAASSRTVITPYMPEFYFIPDKPMPELNLSIEELDRLTVNDPYVEVGNYVWWRNDGQITLNGEYVGMSNTLADAIHEINDINEAAQQMDNVNLKLDTQNLKAWWDDQYYEISDSGEKVPCVIRTSEVLDEAVKHLGYRSKTVPDDVINSVKGIIKTDTDLITESQERLKGVQKVPDSDLSPTQIANLNLAKAVAEAITFGTHRGPFAAIIPPASDRTRTAGLYSRATKEQFISREQLYHAKSAIETTIHESSHHTSGKEDGDPALAAEISKNAAKIIKLAQMGAFDKYISAPNFKW